MLLVLHNREPDEAVDEAIVSAMTPINELNVSDAAGEHGVTNDTVANENMTSVSFRRLLGSDWQKKMKKSPPPPRLKPKMMTTMRRIKQPRSNPRIP